ncbi:MAG: coproporphyrinogen dehydrogenase HemZ [Lachnospiraceae bacterium]|nr:coproporphyrinogen dehydrogenase HemZ [Lachnospiraceae bacterium]
MITIRNHTFSTYDNDIRALVNAFYPGVPIQFGTEQVTESGRAAETEIFLDIDSLKCEMGPIGESGAGRDSGIITARFAEKTQLKKALYQRLSAQTGRSLPWGTLTGIRPVRILEMLEQQGLTPAEADSRLREQFLISADKIRLMKDIYRTEQEVLSRIDYRNTCSLYIGIPFCPTRCLYCSFTSNPIDLWADRVDLYVECLKREMQTLAAQHADAGTHRDRSGFIPALPISTVYIGGGTPTALTAAQLDRLLTEMEEIFCIYGNEGAAAAQPDVAGKTPLAELTVEAGRPDSITEEKLRVLKAHRVGRISINPQTFQQKTLDLIGRRHTVEETVRAYELARRLGFDNINMDLIMGLPGENLKDVEMTLAKVRELQPDNLTVHTLAVKRAARLSTEQKAWGGIERKGSSPDAGEASEIACMTELGAECAAELGMHQYYLYRQKNMAGNQENVGYAKPGKESLYNILMMEEKHSVYGLGAGSSTKEVIYADREAVRPDGRKKVIRSDNPKSLKDYAAHFGITL